MAIGDDPDEVKIPDYGKSFLFFDLVHGFLICGCFLGNFVTGIDGKSIFCCV